MVKNLPDLEPQLHPTFASSSIPDNTINVRYILYFHIRFQTNSSIYDQLKQKVLKQLVQAAGNAFPVFFSIAQAKHVANVALPPIVATWFPFEIMPLVSDGRYSIFSVLCPLG